jgi:hypothetical protein
MATTSSILRSAESAQQKAREFQDQLAAYQWDNSTKTYGDYVAYEQYLTGRQASSGDPATQLSYVKKLDSARSGYISNEVQRQSINVIEGNGTNVDKYNSMLNLYYGAANAGQDDLAQSLRLQLDNLSVTIQNDNKAAISANKEAAAQVTKQIDDQVKDAVTQIQDNAKYALEQYHALGPDKFKEATGSDIFSMLANMVNSQDPNNPGLVQVYDSAMKATPDPSKLRDYQVRFNDLADGGSTGIKLPGVGDVTYKDLADQAYAQSIGQTLFDTVDTGNGVEFTRNKETGYAWGRDENGNYKLMPIYNPKQNFTSGVADPKKKDAQLSYDTLLKNSGFEVTKSGDQLIVRNNGEFDSAGVPRGQQVQLYVDKDGNLQAVNGNSAYSLGFDQKTGKYTGLKAQTSNPINLLGDQFNARYFAGKDLSKLPGGTIGTIDTNSPLAHMEAGPLSRAQPTLQGLQTPIPHPVAPTIAQPGAVNPMNAPANATITIAQPKPLPTITPAKPQPLPNISITSKPQPAPTITLSKGGYSGPGISF